MSIKGFANRLLATAATTAALTFAAFAQVTPAAGYTPPDDTPKFSVGALIYGDYTYADSPQTKDTDGNAIHSSAFNLSRAYINVTGNLNHFISFRYLPRDEHDAVAQRQFGLPAQVRLRPVGPR